MAAKPFRLPPLPTIRDLLQLYRLHALKHLSQNFLMDMRIIDKIVNAAGKISDAEVCEVGPGPGGITRSILNRNPRRLIVIEKDKRFIPTLEHLAEASTNCPLEIIIGDVLNYRMENTFCPDLRVAWEDRPPKINLIGNLPFNVSTPLIIKWLHAISERQSAWSFGRTKMTLTFQKEVAERMVAYETGEQRCRLSVMCQNWCHVYHKFTIKGSAFIPKPDVDVGVVNFIPRVTPIIQLPFPLVEKVVRTIFGFRQKYSIRGAERLFPVAAREKLAGRMYKEADIDPKVKPFQLTIEEFGKLCQKYKSICDEVPSLYKYNHRASKSKRMEFDTFNIDDNEEEENEDEDILVLGKDNTVSKEKFASL